MANQATTELVQVLLTLDSYCDAPYSQPPVTLRELANVTRNAGDDIAHSMVSEMLEGSLGDDSVPTLSSVLDRLTRRYPADEALE